MKTIFRKTLPVLLALVTIFSIPETLNSFEGSTCNWESPDTDHTWKGDNGWINAGENGCFRECEVCGYIAAVTEHSYDTWTNCDENNHIHTCLNCGSTQTLAHNYTSYVSNEAGGHSQICDNCGHIGAITPHEPVCMDEDETPYQHTYKCDICGWVSLPEDHKWTGETGWINDALDGCHQECGICGYKTSITPHSYIPQDNKAKADPGIEVGVVAEAVDNGEGAIENKAEGEVVGSTVELLPYCNKCRAIRPENVAPVTENVNDTNNVDNVNESGDTESINVPPPQNLGKSKEFWEDKRAEGWIYPIPEGYSGIQLYSAFIGNRQHVGFDLMVDDFTPVLAMQSGKVVEVTTYKFMREHMNTVLIQHNDNSGSMARYCEIRSLVKAGQSVTKGDIIGYVEPCDPEFKNGRKYRDICNGINMLHLEMYYGKDINGESLGTSVYSVDQSWFDYVSLVRSSGRRRDLLDPTDVTNLPTISMDEISYNALTIQGTNNYDEIITMSVRRMLKFKFFINSYTNYNEQKAVFDKQTYDAVANFQRNADLFVSGNVDADTWKALIRTKKSNKMNQSLINLSIMETAGLQINLSGSEKSRLVWVSSDDSIVSVDKGGLIKAVSEGTAYIYAIADGVSYGMCTVFVDIGDGSVLDIPSDEELSEGLNGELGEGVSGESSGVVSEGPNAETSLEAVNAETAELQDGSSEEADKMLSDDPAGEYTDKEDYPLDQELNNEFDPLLHLEEIDDPGNSSELLGFYISYPIEEANVVYSFFPTHWLIIFVFILLSVSRYRHYA